MRQARAKVSAAIAVRTGAEVPIVVCNLPYALMREVATAFTKSPTDSMESCANADTAMATHTKHRKTARDTAAALVEAFVAPGRAAVAALKSPTIGSSSSGGSSTTSGVRSSKLRKVRAAGRPSMMVLYSSVDERFDVMPMK